MNLKDLRIVTQLQIGLATIFIFVLILGIMTWTQMESLWQETKGLYDHPLTVRRAVGELKADILVMHRNMKDLILTENDAERPPLIQDIDTCEADAHRQLDALCDRYLGPRSDIDVAQQRFVQWKGIRDETIRLLQAGKTAEATSRTKPGGLGGAHVEQILSQIKKISDFAVSRGDQFYRDAESHKDTLVLRLGIILIAILLCSCGVAYVLLKAITTPLQELTNATNLYRQGRLDVRSQYTLANEFGTLSSSFNALAETVQAEMESREKARRLAEIMLREEELHSFCRELLKALLQQTDSQVGAMYLLNTAKTDFERFESIGLAPEGRQSFSATTHEGEFGPALATRQIQFLTDIPPETPFVFATVSGDFRPKELITIPILTNQHVVMMISLASIRKYSPASIKQVNDSWSVLIARVNGVLAFRQIREFSEKLAIQNQELEGQKRQLVTQSAELNEQNIELSMQKQQLDETNRLKSAFLSNMSHELRTPLNSVIALAGVLNRRLHGTIPDAEYGYLEVIERNGKHLLSLINDILDLSRIEAGREEINLSRFLVHELVAEVVAMIDPQAQEKGIGLLNQVAPELSPMTSDATKCRHILQNLIGNAVKFTETGSVTVSTREVGDDLEILVTDTGIGIPQDKLSIIFEEFRQADETTARKFGGTGLGLSIARKYAALLRGKVTVSSEVGKGSIFTFRLPLTFPSTGQGLTQALKPASMNKSDAGIAETIDKPRSPEGAEKRLLLVEDSEPAVIQMTDILALQGYRVIVARNGKQALEQIEQAIPDAMILDLMMPEVDGFEVLRLIRAREQTKTIPVLILTAKHVSKDELSFLKGNHISQLVQKGDISRTQLLAAVSKMLCPKAPASPQQDPGTRVTTAPGLRPEVAVPPSATPLTPHSAGKTTSGRPVILVVEDNPDNLLTVRAVLQDTYALIESADGRDGVEKARQHKPALILMDIALPIMDGVQALNTIKSEKLLRHIPVVALTASAMKGSREEILALGFDGYIAKPIAADLLHKTIQGLLHGNE